MNLRSMTGFARADGAVDGLRWVWEIRSVNGKGLDIRLRVPGGMERLDQLARERAAKALTRGNVQATLSVQRENAGARFTLNEEVLERVLAAMEKIRARVAVAPPTVDGILNIRGVVELAEEEPGEEERAAYDEAIIRSFDTALAELVVMRAREGAAIAAILLARIDEIETMTRAAEAAPSRTPEAIRARLAEQVAILMGASPTLDPDRLHQEAVMLATKADIREEIDRLYAHVAAARILIGEGGAIGRKLDFLSQEFNREVNTLCSKANDRSLTAIGLELKSVVDQLREQIQNLE